MRAALIFLTVAEIAIFAGALVAYLIRIARSLRRTSETLGKIAFGVRAIETQTHPIGHDVTEINDRLATIGEVFGTLADRAETRRTATGG